MKLIKGKSYIFFGNFPNCEEVAAKLSKELGITAKAFLSKTDTTSVMEYCNKDEELLKLKNQNEELKKQNKELFEIREKQKLKIENYRDNYSRRLFK